MEELLVILRETWTMLRCEAHSENRNNHYIPSAWGLLFMNSCKSSFHFTASSTSTTPWTTTDPFRLMLLICSEVRFSRSLKFTRGIHYMNSRINGTGEESYTVGTHIWSLLCDFFSPLCHLFKEIGPRCRQAIFFGCMDNFSFQIEEMGWPLVRLHSREKSWLVIW